MIVIQLLATATKLVSTFLKCISGLTPHMERPPGSSWQKSRKTWGYYHELPIYYQNIINLEILLHDPYLFVL